MRPRKLFHTIVVLGATLTGGCGSTVDDDDAGSDAAMMLADAGDVTDAGAVADAAMDAAMDNDAGGDFDAGEDAMVLIL